MYGSIFYKLLQLSSVSGLKSHNRRLYISCHPLRQIQRHACMGTSLRCHGDHDVAAADADGVNDA